VRALREKLEHVRNECREAERAYDLEKVAQLRHGVIPDLENELETDESELHGGNSAGALLREEVTKEKIAEVVSRWAGIPLSRLLEGEREKLMRLESVLHERVIGQDEAVKAVADAVLRSRAGIQNPNRPLGAFMFLGPTGVGKTELARTLAHALFDSEENMVRLDMSEYMEKHSVSRLVGAPPGYIGFEEGGQLTEAVRRKPYSVLLLDEIEKSHPAVFNILLQIMDDGRLTDSHGRTVNFRNTIMIMTSNVGSPALLEGVQEDGSISEVHRKQVMHELKATFRPEFLNRVDDVILFEPLTLEQIEAIVGLQLGDFDKRLAQQGLKLEIINGTVKHIARQGYDPVYGARPMKRFIQQQLETPVARKIISGELSEGDAVEVDVKDGELVVG